MSPVKTTLTVIKAGLILTSPTDKPTTLKILNTGCDDSHDKPTKMKIINIGL